MEVGHEQELHSETSLERMVTAMRESAARLNGIIQSAMDAIITVDEHQDIVIFNPAAEQMFGCAGGRRAGDAARTVHSAALSRGASCSYRSFGATGVTTRRMGGQSEIIGLRANGEEFPAGSLDLAGVGGREEAVHRDPARYHGAQAMPKRRCGRARSATRGSWSSSRTRSGSSAKIASPSLNRACVAAAGGDSVAQLGRQIAAGFHSSRFSPRGRRAPAAAGDRGSGPIR